MMAVITSVPWATAPDAVASSQHRALDSIFNTQVIFGRGGRTDDISGYYDMEGYKSTMPKYMSVVGDNYSRFQGSGMAETNYGGGNTPSNPGAYNWATLQRNADRGANAVKAAVSYRMENKRLAKAKQLKKNKDALSAVYGYGTDPYSTAYATAGQNVANAQKANQIKSVQNFASQVVPPSQNLTASMQAESNKLVPGASKPIKGRKSQSVNLIYPNGNPPATKQGSRKPGKATPYSGPQPPAPPLP